MTTYAITERERAKWKEIDTTVEWLNRFTEDWKKNRDSSDFPQKLVAAQALSMAEDLSNQLTGLMAEALEMHSDRHGTGKVT